MINFESDYICIKKLERFNINEIYTIKTLITLCVCPGKSVISKKELQTYFIPIELYREKQIDIINDIF